MSASRDASIPPVLAVVAPQTRLRDWLEHIGERRGFEVLPLLDTERTRSAPGFDMDALLEQARVEIGHDHLAGITSFWDFPSSAIAAVLAEEYDLPTPGLAGILPFEHKYWSRSIQQRIAPDDTPPFAAVDVFDGAVLQRPPLRYPFWLKPVKSHAGHLGFGIRSEPEYRQAIAELRGGIRRLGDPFQNVLDRIEHLPRDVADVGGAGAIAEGMLHGHQCTLEGYVHDGQIEIYGFFDIHRAGDGSTFTHYLYPSRLPESARARMRSIATALVADVGYDRGAFNIEFFVDDDRDRTWILEVNPRISQEHSHLMDWVDGATNLEVMAEAALGREPDLSPGHGSAAVAGKFFHRRWEDAIVTRAPDTAQVDAIQRAFAPCVIELLVESGTRLADLPHQEPYSYLVAYIYLAGHDEAALHERYQRVVEELGLRFEPVGSDRSGGAG